VKRNGTVIVYHAVGPCPDENDPENLFMPAERFEAQMDFLARRRVVVPLDEVVHGSAPENSVAITFDDGFRNVLTHAAPVLLEHKFPATVFVPAAWLGQTSAAWYEPAGCDGAVMAEDDLRAAARDGLEIGSHGYAHVDLGAADPDEAEADIQASLERLAAVLGQRPRYMAYPYGRHSPAARRAAADRFEAAFAIDEPHEGLYAYERVGITRLDGDSVFALKTSGRYIEWRRSKLGSKLYGVVRPLLPRARRHRSRKS
jgi:peptidoglycan/xylan/chitin deacetylase (PgdA/CDA1 family)